MLPYLDLGFRQLPMYGLMSALGILVAGLFAYRAAEQYGVRSVLPVQTMRPVRPELPLCLGQQMQPVDMVEVLGIGAIGAFIGMHLLYALVQFPHWKELSLWEIFGGSVFYGGLLGGLGLGWLWVRIRKYPAGPMADIAACAIPLFHAFGRVGCFFAGCCYGIPFSHGFVMHDSLNPVGDGVARFPVQLLEALLLLILFLVLNGIRKKRLSLLKEEGAATEQKRKPNRREGSLLPLYLLSYAVIRFGDEFLRGDTYRGIWLFFSTSQWISVFILAGIAIYYTAAGRRRTDTAA